MSDHNSTRIFDILDTFNSQAYEQKWDEIDACLATVNWDAEPIECVIAYLRGSFPMRPKLAGWDAASMHAKKSLVARYGEDRAHHALKGLPIPFRCNMVLK